MPFQNIARRTDDGRRPKAQAVALGAALFLLAGACGSSAHRGASGSTSTSSPAATTVPETTPSTASSTTAVPVTTPGTTAVAECTAAGMRGTFSEIPGTHSAGHVEARVVLTNTATTPCATGGYVGMQLLGSGGAHLPTNVVREPGTVTQILLAPGQSASAVAQYSPDIAGQGDSTGTSCQPVAVNTQVTPPNDTHQLVAPGPGSPVCESGTIDMRPLQSGADAGP